MAGRSILKLIWYSGRTLFGYFNHYFSMAHVVAGLFLTFFFLELLVELILNEMNLTYVHQRLSDKR
ncbi:MAG: hypothetical protein ACE5I0_08995, partial [Candidatus Binatia bacterium]